MSELITYLEETLKVTTKDLELSDKERQILIGKHRLLDMIKVIEEKGYPENDNR